MKGCRKPIVLALGLAVCLATAGAAPDPKLTWTFAGTAADHKLWNYRSYLKVDFFEEGGECFLSLRNEGPEKIADESGQLREMDNAWRVESVSFAVEGGAAFAVRVRARGTAAMQGPTPQPRVEWFDADGQPLKVRDAEGKVVQQAFNFNFRNCAGFWTDTVRSGVVPPLAASAVIKLQGDQPNIRFGEWLEIASVRYYEQAPDAVWDFGDLTPPSVERVSPSPCADPAAPVSIRVSDPSGVKRESVTCALDGCDVTADVTWDGDVLT